MTQNSLNVITVEIHGQQYPIESNLAESDVIKLATYVSERMKVVAKKTATGDSHKVAVLTALNIADELFRCRETDQSVMSQVLTRVAALETVVDQALPSES